MHMVHRLQRDQLSTLHLYMLKLTILLMLVCALNASLAWSCSLLTVKLGSAHVCMYEMDIAIIMCSWIMLRNLCFTNTELL